MAKPKGHKLAKTKSKGARFRLPDLSTHLDTKKLPSFDKRFNSVRSRKYVSNSRILRESSEKTSPKLPTAFESIKEALPAAFLKKKLALEKTEDDSKNEASVKKLIKVKDPKEYHYGGKISNEMLTGKFEDNLAESKILQGKSYCISVSPSQKMSKKSLKKKILLQHKLIKKNTEEFKIEDQYEYRAACKKIRYKNIWHPIFSKSATLTNFKGYTYLIGGVNHSVIKQVCRLCDVDSEYLWKVEKDDIETTLQRYGHTCSIYEDSLVIFGGQKGSGLHKTKRIVLNDIWLYKPQMGELEQILAVGGPELRYGHSAGIAGNYLVIYGGMNEMGDVLSDIGVMNLETKKWLKITMTDGNKKKETPPGLCFSGMAAVFYEGRKKNPDGFFREYYPDKFLDPFLPKSRKEKVKDKEIILEGCYMFGGVTNNNDIVNDLYILKIKEEGVKFEWEKVEEYNGKAPCERCHHFMDYLKFNNSIILFGGRNDNSAGSSVLNDMYFLQIDTLTWINVEFINKKLAPRFSHACAIQDSRMIIFGGVGSDFSMEKTLEVVEFDPEKIARMSFTNILH